MPIYEFACPKCRVIFSFLSKRLNPERAPVCPRCGSKKMEKQMSAFASPRGAKEAAGSAEAGDPGGPMPDFDDPRVERTMGQIERDLEHMDENNPRHMAQLMKRMKDILPPGTMPKDMDVAIKRLEAGEDPEKIEADLGDLLGGALGGEDEDGGMGAGGGYARDQGLYDY